MHFTTHDQLLLLALLAVLAALLVAAPIVRVPYPILLVLGGLALGFMPGIPSIQLPPDLVLGAVVSPTDTLAATKIARRLGVPRRIITVIEGESLVNDGTALVLYKVAVTAVLGGPLSGWGGGLRLVLG